MFNVVLQNHMLQLMIIIFNSNNDPFLLAMKL